MSTEKGLNESQPNTQEKESFEPITIDEKDFNFVDKESNVPPSRAMRKFLIEEWYNPRNQDLRTLNEALKIRRIDSLERDEWNEKEKYTETTIAGCCIYSVRSREMGFDDIPDANIELILIKKDFRGKGLGKLLLKKVIDKIIRKITQEKKVDDVRPITIETTVKTLEGLGIMEKIKDEYSGKVVFIIDNSVVDELE